MPFVPKVVIEKSRPSSTPLMANSEKLRLEGEFRKLNTQLGKLVDAVEEIREYLKTIP